MTEQISATMSGASGNPELAALAAAVPVVNGQAVLSVDTLAGSGLSSLLKDYGGGASVVIRNATAVQSADRVELSGIVSYLGMADVPAIAVLRLDGAGKPIVSITFTAGGPANSPW